MGRLKKYYTAESKLEANKLASAKYYKKNRDEKNSKDLARYHKRIEESQISHSVQNRLETVAREIQSGSVSPDIVADFELITFEYTHHPLKGFEINSASLVDSYINSSSL